MNILRGMTAFVEVAKLGSYARAARSLGLSRSVVSRQVMDLEEWLGVELMQRTTRTLSLTEQGELYLARCKRVLVEVDDLKELATDSLEQPSGTLRLTAPNFFARECLQGLLPGFLESYPDVSVALTAVDRFVDLVDEGFDLALRIGELPGSTLVARKLMDVELVVTASPAYLKAHGKPRKPEELRGHNCIVDTVATFSNRWPMKRGKKRMRVAVTGNVSVNSGEIARNLGVAGVGFTLLPRFFVREQLRNGELVSVLDGHPDMKVGLYAVYPKVRRVVPKVRSFIDYVVANLGDQDASNSAVSSASRLQRFEDRRGVVRDQQGKKI